MMKKNLPFVAFNRCERKLEGLPDTADTAGCRSVLRQSDHLQLKIKSDSLGWNCLDI